MSARRPGHEARTPFGAPSKLDVTRTEAADGVVVLAVRGELDLLTGARFRAQLQEELDAGRRVVVDLCACDFIDSTGLNAIIRGSTEHRGHVAVACLADGLVRRAFKVTRLHDLIPVHGSVDEAIGALGR